MVEMRSIQERNLTRVYSNVVGGIFLTSIILLGNGTMSVVNNYESSGQVMKISDDRTDMIRSFSYELGISSSMPIYSSMDNSCCIEKVLISDDKLESLKKLNIISELQDNWNGNGAKALSNKLIDKVKTLIMFLDIQPDIFPTACNSIQIEYDKENDKHMEIELTEDSDVEIFTIDQKGNGIIKKIQFDITKINGMVKNFYG